MPSRKRNIVARVDREYLLQQALGEQLAYRLVPGPESFPPDILEALDAYVHVGDGDEEIEKAPLLVGAPPGAGKSSLAAYFERDLRQKMIATQEKSAQDASEEVVVVKTATADPEKSRAQTCASQELVKAFYVGSSTSKTSEDEGVLLSSLQTLIRQAARKAKRIVLVVDAVDRLESTLGNDGTALQWLPNALPANVRVILFARVQDPRPFSASGGAHRLAHLKELDEEEEKIENPETQEDPVAKGDSQDTACTATVGARSSTSPRTLSEPLGTYSDLNIQQMYGDNTSSDDEANLARVTREKGIEFAFFDNAPSEERAASIIEAFIKWTAQRALEAQNPDICDKGTSTKPIATAPRALSILGTHVAHLAVFASKVGSIGALFVALRAIHLAAQLSYDVHDLVKKICAVQRSPRSGIVSAVVETLMHFFARGNYPTRISVTAAWEAAQQSACITEVLRPSSADKKPLPSPRELAQWRELHSILTTGQGLLDDDEAENGDLWRESKSEGGDNNDQDNDDDDGSAYSEDEFEDEEPAKTEETKEECATEAKGASLNASEVDETLREMQKFPVHLLGGAKREPLGDWLYKALGYICASRYGLTLEEVSDTLDEACRKDLEAAEDTDSFQEPVLKMADDSLEDWLLNETMPEEEEAEAPASIVPENVKEQLKAVLPCFTITASDGLFSVVPADRPTHLAVTRVVLSSPDYAPTVAHVEKIHKTLERRLYGKLKSEFDEESSFLEPSSPQSPSRPQTTSTSSPKRKPRPCEEDYARKDSCSWEVNNLSARWRLVLVQVLSAKQKRPSADASAPSLARPDQRFVEEYPWLLASNGRWVGLLNAIADLYTFRALWDATPVLRSDLLQYWKDLSSSAMRAADSSLDPMAADASDGDSSQDDTTDDGLPTDASDGKSPVLGPSESLPGQSFGLVPPFGPGDDEADAPAKCWLKCDPVEHYTRAVEIEQGRARGHVDRIRALATAIMEICEFLYAFGHLEVSAPDYLHPPLRESRVALLDVELPHGGPSTSDESAKDKHIREHGWKLDVESTGAKLALARSMREEMMNEQHLAQRTQAISKVSDVDEKQKLLSMQRKQSQFFRFRIEQQERFQAKHAKQRASEGDRFRGNTYGENYYSYQRWVWIHFPWMALYHAYAALAHAGGPGDIDPPPMPADVFWLRKKKDPKSDRPPPPKRLTKSKITLPACLTQSTPSLPSLGSPTVGAGMGMGTTLTVKTGDSSLLQQGFGPSHHVAQRLPPNEVPYSSPSVRTLRHGTRFPTFEMMQRERPSTDKMAFFNGGFVDPEAIKAAQEGRVLRAAKSKPDQRDVGSVLSQMRASLPAHLRSYPTTEQEARVAEMNGMLADFRKTLDDLHFEANRKEDDLEALMQQVYERIELDRYTETCIREGEQTISQLTNDVTATTHAIAREETVLVALKRIAKTCEKYPAHDEKHVLQMEGLLESMREDRISLTKDLDEVHLFLRRAREQEQPAIETALDLRREKHNEVLNKLFQWRENERRSRRIKAEREAHRRAIIASTQAEPITYEMTQRRWKEAHRQKLVEEVLEGDLDEVQHSKALAMKRHKAFRKLRKLAGSSDVHEICLKFNDSCQKTEDLLARRRQAFRQIKDLKTRLEDLQKDRQRVCKRKASKSVTIGLKIEECSKQCEAAEERLRVTRENQLTSEALVEQVKVSLGQYRRGAIGPAADEDGEADAHAAVEALLAACAKAVGIPNFRTEVTKEAVQSKVREQRKLSKAEMDKRTKFLFGAANKKPVSLPPRISVDVHRAMRKSVLGPPTSNNYSDADRR
ncbi:TPR repeat-containing protein DDB_G0287407 [Hondaea fermentalgiana]|uniref:TPR repeat-containing protein DDB_G0287407 n=1 Tax=Hondaea fermentalgiana TaxID=2315210 RepID=A0A2R5H1I7_9STRA|nr:TPR repeat-containing protein DDB_G0287407 [Hondaea fermentalgiana]|eukprot:GBG34671.1 TPR repeat-containing protein DDB_G0287407 [Hondaea fermentalgiana]